MQKPPHVTLQHLEAMAHRAPVVRLAEVVEPLNETLAKYAVNTRMRVAYFLGYLLEESAEFNAYRENLNYPSGLILELWGLAYFPGDSANDYHRQPEKLANYIYADANCPPGYRLGNDLPGDGWKYRPWGPTKICGKTATHAYLRKKGLPLDTDPEDLLKPQFLCDSAGQFWAGHGLNHYADAEDFAGYGDIIGGDVTRLKARKKYLELALASLPEERGFREAPTRPATARASGTMFGLGGFNPDRAMPSS